MGAKMGGGKDEIALTGLVPPWEHVPPVWEVRIGEYRAFYDIEEKAATVIVRAIRDRPARKTTEEILGALTGMLLPNLLPSGEICKPR